MVRARGPFSLASALQFLNGFTPAGVAPQHARYAAAHVVNGRAVLIDLAERTGGALHLSVRGREIAPADVEAAAALVRRMFALDLDGDAFYGRIGAADPVLAALQRRFRGLRPVLFGSPFEALCWAIIGQRIGIPHAARLKARLAARVGPLVDVDGETHQAFPGPGDLLALDPSADGAALGLPTVKLERLRRLAERGSRGDFEATRLLALPPAEARAWLEESPGIGPWASEFTLIRGAGHPDLLPRGERRLLVAVQRYYELASEPSFAAVEQLGERWAGFRSWAAFLLRVALQADIHEITGPASGVAPAAAAHGRA
jgi:3-methyladenine DNA glycosylase/8-oxoguanine DNA glycosylase